MSSDENNQKDKSRKIDGNWQTISVPTDLILSFKIRPNSEGDIKKYYGFSFLHDSLNKSEKRKTEIFNCYPTLATIYELIRVFEGILGSKLSEVSGNYATQQRFAVHLTSEDSKFHVIVMYNQQKEGLIFPTKETEKVKSFIKRRVETYEIYQILKVPIFSIQIISLVPRNKVIFKNIIQKFIEKDIKTL